MNNENNTKRNATGESIFLSLLTVAFIVLKLTGVISWSWMWVLAPIWIPAALALAILLIVLLVVLVKETTKQVQQKRVQDARATEIDVEAAKHGLERKPGESNLDLKRRIAFFKQSERRANRE